MKFKSLYLIAALSAMTFSMDAQVIDMTVAEEFSPYIYGHNLEHTRAAVIDGLSAQMLRNRKFAGKPSKNRGVASRWYGIGDEVLFLMNANTPYTMHTCHERMQRGNERNSQNIQNLKKGQTAGIGQNEIFLKAGETYQLRTVTKVSAPVTLKVELTDRDGEKVYAEHVYRLEPSEDWVVTEFNMTSSIADPQGSLRFTFNEQAALEFGAISMMPENNFHGLRPDVVENLKVIGPRLLRWPGGNFAGEYRWKDGLLPVDQRAPLGAATEIESQPYNEGYDFHEMNTDDFVALCREVGAEPMITLNLAWGTPEESAQWVEYCNGSTDTEYGKKRAENGHPEPYNVNFWCLGNEMGYGHMEGPKGPQGYAELTQTHADLMLKVTPELKFVSSGPYPNSDWATHSAAILAEKVPYISLHHYANFGNWSGSNFNFTTPEGTRNAYEAVVGSMDGNVHLAKVMRESLDATGKKLHISFDEWNQWYSWYRPSSVAEGIYAARTMHFYLNESNALDIPIVCYFQPVGEGAILINKEKSWLTANGQMFAMLKAHQDAKLCKVTENEDYSTAASLKDGVLTITLVNSWYDKDREFSFDLKGKLIDARLYSSEEVCPYTYFDESALEVKAEKKRISTVLPPHSAAIIRLSVKQK